MIDTIYIIHNVYINACCILLVTEDFFFFTLDEFEKYCNDVADTAAWGGQLEVRIPAICPNNKTLTSHNPPAICLFFD